MGATLMAISYAEALAFIHERSGYDRGFISNPFAGDDAARLGLIRTERVLEALGRPDRSYPILHVAGSKGKGSTSSIAAAMLSASGLTTGRFLSPHLHRFNERFAVNGRPIDDDAFARAVEVVREAALGVEHDSPEIGQLTAWELSTAIALEWFKVAACDAVVLEVGMGGTLDATNVVLPVASLITRLDLEHTAILGSTISEIAANKAGIIKPGVPAFSVNQLSDAMQVIVERAREVNSPLQIAGRDWEATGTSDDFTFRSHDLTLDHLAVTLHGRHQVENAGLAIAALTTVGRTLPSLWVSEESIHSGLRSVSLAGRFEVVEIDEATTVVIDGAHTPASMTMLAEAIRERFPERSLLAIIGMLADKSPRDVLSPLRGAVDMWTATAPASPRRLAVEDLALSLRALGGRVLSSPSVAEALRAAIATHDPGNQPRTILVTGSLTTVAEARAALGLPDDSAASRLPGEIT